MYKVIVSELAHEDLRNIIKYIKDTLCAPDAAAGFADQVQQCYANLKNNPLLYTRCADERLKKDGYRRVLIKNYVLVFKVDAGKKIVKVYRLFYGAEDYPNKI